MVRSHSFAWLLVSLLSLTLAAPLQADITPSEDVDPILPGNLWWWTGGGDSSTGAYIGKTAAGSVTVNLGSNLNSYFGYIGMYSGSAGVVTVDGGGSTWTSSDDLYVGYYCSSQGTLNITNGGAVSNTNHGVIGYWHNTSVATVDGIGSTWTSSGSFQVGRYGHGTLNITNGGAVSNSVGFGSGFIGTCSGSTGVVTVDGSGSTWTNSGDLYVGYSGQGTLNITGGGLVSVAGTLTIDNDSDGNGFINMTTGGMLVIPGQADDSLVDFMGLINGTDAIRYWDDSILDWADINGATRDEDYTLIYQTEGDLAGYTMLTVPEPTAMLLLALGGLAMLKRRR